MCVNNMYEFAVNMLNEKYEQIIQDEQFSPYPTRLPVLTWGQSGSLQLG